ncbi:alpha-L-fucosidase [bacterium]|nr:alpha-L-fucosidase [bacterium]
MPKAAKPQTRAEVIEWFKDVKFGLFIHWGVYALLGKGEWIRNVGHIPEEEYQKLPPKFNPTKYDPEEWAKLAKLAGVKYAVFTTKHHDGFCMWDTKTTDYKVTNTPYGKDVLAMYHKAFEKQGIRAGYYFSIMDWHHPDYLPRLEWEKESRPEGDASLPRFVKYMQDQIKEIVSRDPFVLWYDGGWMNAPDAYAAAETNAMARKLNPDILINDRAFTKEDLTTPEQRIPPTGMKDENGNPLLWEACITMTGHWWGYDKYEKNYKTSEYLIRMLVDIVSKGGNLLLNIGPKPDGTIQKEFVDRLRAIGKWMDRYSEAIYGTTASPFNLLPFYGRVTTKGDKLYVHVFEWPADLTVRLPNLGNVVKKAYLLEQGKPALEAVRDGADWLIKLPKKAPDKVASVLVVQLDGAPQVEPVVVGPDAKGVVSLPALYGLLEGPHGQRIRYESCDGIIHAGNWIRPPDSIEWEFTLPKAGVYNVVLDAAAEQGGSEVELFVNGKTAARMAPNGVPFSSGDGSIVGAAAQVIKVSGTGGAFKHKTVGSIKLKKGPNKIKFVLKTVKGEKAMDLRGVALKPVKS